MATIADTAMRRESWLEAARVASAADRHAPGIAILHATVAKLFQPLGVDPRVSVAYWHAFLGGVYVFATLRLVHGLQLALSVRVWIAALMYSSGATILFLGYFEDYTLPYLITTVVALAAHRYVEGTIRLRWFALLSLANVALHVQGVLLLPTVAYLVAVKRTEASITLQRNALTLMAITAAGAIAYRLLPGMQIHYRPLVGGWSARSIASVHYIWDATNLLFLLCPSLFVVLSFALYKRGGADRDQAAPSDVAMRRRWLIAVSGFPYLLFLLFFRPDLGMPRDWDLFTAMTPVLILSLIPLLQRNVATNRQWILPAVILAAMQTGSWAAINANASFSEARYRDTLVYDDSHAGYAYELLAKYCHKNGRLEEALALWRQAIDADGNPRYTYSAAITAAELGRLDKAIEMMRKHLLSRPDNREARINLLTYLATTRDFDSVSDVAREGIALLPDSPEYNVFLAFALFELHQYDNSYRQLKRCLTLPLTPSMREDVTKAVDHLEERGR